VSLTQTAAQKNTDRVLFCVDPFCSVLYKYKWAADEGQVVPIVPEDDKEGIDLDSDYEYFTTMADLLNVDTSGSAQKGFTFNLDYLIEDAVPSKNQYGDSGSVKTFRDACIEDTADYSDMDSSGHMSEDDKSAGREDSAKRSSSPVDLVEADTATQATSTLTDDTSEDVAASLEQLMLQNPALAQLLYLKNSAQLQSTSVAVSPYEGADGN
jgi:hypothetical protein